MIKTIIFDFNGTLLDDVKLNFEIFNMLAKDFNARQITMEEYRDVFDFPVIDVYRGWGFDVDDGKFVKIADRFHEYYNAYVYKRCDVFPYVKPLLKKLKEKYKLVCLSATKYETLVGQLKHYEIYDYFDEVIGMSDKFAYGKIDLGTAWIKNNNIDPSTVIFLGDTSHDQKVAAAMNVKMLSVACGHNSKEKLASKDAIIIEDIREIEKYL